MLTTLPVRFETEHLRTRFYDLGDHCAHAMGTARTAARRVLEDYPLGEEIQMPDWVWEYWETTLGDYSLSLPTGTRLGKRWCRTETPGFRYIGTYVASQDPETVGILWTRVVLTFGD